MLFSDIISFELFYTLQNSEENKKKGIQCRSISLIKKIAPLLNVMKPYIQCKNVDDMYLFGKSVPKDLKTFPTLVIIMNNPNYDDEDEDDDEDQEEIHFITKTSLIRNLVTKYFEYISDNTKPSRAKPINRPKIQQHQIPHTPINPNEDDPNAGPPSIKVSKDSNTNEEMRRKMEALQKGYS